MHVVRCDWKPDKVANPDYAGAGFCRVEFRSASALSVLHQQLAAAGWTVRSGSRSRPTVHLCPGHKPAPAWSVTPPSQWRGPDEPDS